MSLCFHYINLSALIEVLQKRLLVQLAQLKGTLFTSGILRFLDHYIRGLKYTVTKLHVCDYLPYLVRSWLLQKY